MYDLQRLSPGREVQMMNFDHNIYAYHRTESKQLDMSGPWDWKSIIGTADKNERMKLIYSYSGISINDFNS